MAAVCLSSDSCMPRSMSSYADCWSRSDRGMLPFGGASTTPSSQDYVANCEPRRHSLGKRVRDGETDASLQYFSRALCAQFLEEASPATTTSSTTTAAVGLYQHCVDQAAGAAAVDRPAGARYSPVSAFGPSPASMVCGITYTTPPNLLGASRQWAYPVPHAPQLQTYHVPQLPEHQEYLNLISPLKRRRPSYAVSSGAMPAPFAPANARFPAAEPAARRADVVDDALLMVCQEQAQLQLSRIIPDHRSCQPSIGAGPCADELGLARSYQAGPSAQHISSRVSSSSQVLDGIMRWMHALQIDNPETAHFAFHLWTRVAPAVVQQCKLSACAVVSGCLWIALKLQEHRLAVPSATNMGKIARVSARDLKAAEACVMTWVDWAPLSHWKKL